MPSIRRISLLLVLACLCIPALAADGNRATFSTDKLDTTPDLMQSLPAAALPDGGAAYCGPVAVSNSLLWLARNGYERLAPLASCDWPAASRSNRALTSAFWMRRWC